MDAGIFPCLLVWMGAGTDWVDCIVACDTDSDAAQKRTAGRMAAGSVSGVYAVRRISELRNHCTHMIFIFLYICLVRGSY